MKLNIVQRQRDDGENLIPLINIVFLLLIFFMLAGTFKSADQLDVSPPSSLSQKSAEEEQVVVLLSATGRLAIGEREVDLSELRGVIMERLSAEPELQVQLKADESLAAEALIEVMESLRDAGLKKLVLLTMLDDA